MPDFLFSHSAFYDVCVFCLSGAKFFLFTLILQKEFLIPPFQLIALQGSSFIKAIKFYFTTNDVSGVGVVVNTETISATSCVLKIML